MEFIQWLAQSKSLETAQVVAASLANSYIAVYLTAFLLLLNRDSFICLCMLLAGLFVSYSSLYNQLSAEYIHLTYFLLCSIACIFVDSKKVAVACASIGVFNIIYALDSAINATTQTWLYDNYEIITTVLHWLVIIALAQWRDLERGMERIIDFYERIKLCVRMLLRL